MRLVTGSMNDQAEKPVDQARGHDPAQHGTGPAAFGSQLEGQEKHQGVAQQAHQRGGIVLGRQADPAGQFQPQHGGGLRPHGMLPACRDTAGGL